MFFFEHSKVPVILSYLAPITINAICLGPFVFCRGKASERLRRHETIHWEQQKELLIVGFLVVYLYDFLKNTREFGWSRDAYRFTRAEIEAHTHDEDVEYLDTRVRYRWLSARVTIL